MFGGYGFLRRGAVGRMSSPSSLFYDLSKGFDFISNFFENGSSYFSFGVFKCDIFGLAIIYDFAYLLLFLF